ncbi:MULTISPECIES: PPC domain-containing DNA-binding protein [unclassified Spiroplasma]|uniref:PPC domain-containing DNA-binding protein n=1 Tax=unclassified Spiroplasma TaxID=2637901 RepID=UPI00313ABAFC
MKLKMLQSNVYALRLEVEEEIVSTLEKIMLEKQWGFCQIQGIGAVKNCTLGYYVLERQDYDWVTISEMLELTSAMGSIAWDAMNPNIPLVHCHITVGNSEHKPFAGHLKSADIALTGEFFITVVSKEKVFRKIIPPHNIKLWDLN